MHKNVLVIVLAAVAVVVAVAALLMNKLPIGGTASFSGEKVYLYSAGRETTAVYIPLRDGAVFGVMNLYDFLAGQLDFLYYMSKDSGVVNVLAKSGDVYWKYTYFSRPGKLCINYTATATIAGETITATNTECKSSRIPLPKARSFDEMDMLTRQLYDGLLLYAPQLHWQRNGTVQTPFGQAAVYISTVRLAENYKHSYEKQVLQDGTVYSLKFWWGENREVAPAAMYTLRDITAVTPELRKVIDELYKDVVVAKPSGGLDILRVAQKIGMSYEGEWPAAIVFFDLQCPYCALLFKHNYTLFQGHKLVLVDLVVHPDAQPAHEQLRCLYQSSPKDVIPTLRVVYDRFLAQDPNFTSTLPQQRCSFDSQAGMQLATLLAGQNVGTPMVVVVYPNDTYTVIVGYQPAEIAKALKG